MKQKILNFLKAHNIFFTDKGSNVKKGNINIKCPFCGESDKSEHLGIDLKTGVYGCWRNSSHRGKDFTSVIQILLGCSFLEARRLWQVDKPLLQEESFLSQVKSKLEKKEELKVVKLGGVEELKLDKNFHQINSIGITARFYEYFERRGFKRGDLFYFLKNNDIKCSLVGEFHDRIIFPVYYQNKLVTWISRSIYDEASLPYKDLDINRSVRHAKFCLYDYDFLVLQGGKVLFITEGVFDGLKLKFFLPEGYDATCLFTKTIREEQKYLLRTLSEAFEEICLLLDKDAQVEMLKMKKELSFIKNITFKFIDIKDPGKMTEEQVLELI